MLSLFKKRKSTQELCLHQRNSNPNAETVLEPANPVKPKSSSVQEDINEAPREQIINEKVPDHRRDEPPASAITGDAHGPCAICKAEQREARRYRWILISGLFFPFSVQALDATIIASALPFIASDFHELSQLNWIVSAFNLTSATFIPSWGQFADIFGRHAALQMALVTMLVGSALCSGAPTNAFPMLLVGRALQGVSCAGLNILTRIILADKVSLKENAKNNTIFALVGGLGYGFGPVIGGYLTQVSWRWCFIINIPVAVSGIVLAFFVLRPELLGPQNMPSVDSSAELPNPPTLKKQLLTIDYGGQGLFLFGMGLLVLALTWGGSYYPWSDVKVLAPLIIGCILFFAFIVWEHLMMPGHKLAVNSPHRMAMIPMRLIWSRNAGLLMYINFVAGMAMFAVFYFVDLYFALVLAYPSGKAGTQLLYYTPGLGIGVYLAMFTCNVYPRKTWFPLTFGTIIEPLGVTILAVAIKWGNLPVIYGMLGLTGVGTGIRFMPGSLHGVGYFPNDIASIVSMMSLAISLGGTFSMTLMFTVFNNNLSNAGIHFNSGSSSSFNQISALPLDAQTYLRDQASTAIAVSFFALCAFLWLGVIVMCFMGNVDITKKGKGLEGPGKKDFSENVVIKGSYLASLFRKRKVAATEEKSAVQGSEVGNV